MAGVGVAARAAGLLGGEAAAGGGMGNVLGGLAGNIGDIGQKADAAGKSVGGLGDILGKMGGAVNKAVPGFDSILKTLPGLSAALLPLSAGFAGLKKGVELFNDFVAVTSRLTNQFVAAYAPAEAELFTDALKDLNAVIGEQLVPVTRAARDVIRFVADSMAGLTPLFRGLLESGLDKLRPVFSTLGETFRRIMTVAQPFLQLFGEVFVEVLGFVATQVERVASYFNDLLESLRQFLNLPEFKPGESRGKAAASTSFTNAQSFLGRAQASAFMLGSESPEAKRTSILEELKVYFKGGQFVEDAKKAFKAAVVEIKNQAGRAIEGQIDMAGRALGNVLDPGGVLRNLPRFDQVH